MFKKWHILILLAFQIFLSSPALADVVENKCNVSDISSLKFCANNLAFYESLNFVGNVSCHGDDCCSTSYTPLINLQNMSGKTIRGNGYTLTRYDNQKKCPAISLNGVSSFRIENLNLNENDAIPPCELSESCVSTVEVKALHDANGAATLSRNITFDAVNIYNGKYYVVFVSGVDGFIFNNSAISNAGVIGLDVTCDFGFCPNQKSTNIQITNSVFSFARTNGVVIESVTSSLASGNLIANNIFNRNHYHGLWPTPFGAPSPGGQLLVNGAENLKVSDNIIADGRCYNCAVWSVVAVELENNLGPIIKTQFVNNYAYNGYQSVAFYFNSGETRDPSTLISNNYVYGFDYVTNGTANNVDKIPSLNNFGISDNIIYRLVNKTHMESQWPLSGWAIEDEFKVSAFPRLGANPKPLYRCMVNGSKVYDFISFSKECEGQAFHSIYGYSFESTFGGAQPFYRCRNGIDHFISWDNLCEGKVTEGMLGYAIPVRPLR